MKREYKWLEQGRAGLAQVVRRDLSQRVVKTPGPLRLQWVEEASHAVQVERKTSVKA